jgi:hypothetical protein
MWLIISFMAALAATAAWIMAPKKYKLESLSLMLWGLALMVLADHVLGYSGGPFIEMETDGLITSGTVLGIAMLIPVFIAWEISLVWSKLKEEKLAR